MSEMQDALSAILLALSKQNEGDKEYHQYVDSVFEHFVENKEAADAASKAGKLDETQKANYTKVAKALPDLAKGLQGTIVAFEKGDPIEGAAGVMDICATVSSLLGSVAAASSMGGPVGALAGAVFSIVAMILRMVQPAQQKSMGQVIEEKLRMIQSESIHIDLKTAIDEFGVLYAGYPEYGPVHISMKMLDPLVEGHAAHNLFKASNWLLMPGNAKETAISSRWLDVLATTLHAGSLQIRNFTHLLGIAKEADHPALFRTYKSIAEVHLEKMRALVAVARIKGRVWHLGLPTGLGNAGGIAFSYDGGHVFTRQGADGNETWTNLGGEQQTITLSRDGKGKARHVVTLEGAKEGFEWGGFGTRDTLHWVPFHHHLRAYFRSVGGDWPQDGSDWSQLHGLEECRDITAIPGAEAGEIYVFAVQREAVVARKVKRTAEGVEVSDNLERKNAAGPDETLLGVRVMPGYRPDAAASAPIVTGPMPYVLKERAGVHLIQRGYKDDAIIHPKWDRICGMTLDEHHLWIWTDNAFGCITHRSIDGLLAERADRAKWQRCWVYHRVADDAVLDRSPGRPAIYEEGRSGLTHIEPAADGTVMVVFNARIYMGTMTANRWADGFDVAWDACSPGHAYATRVLKEPIEFWPLFEQRMKVLEGITGDHTLHWDPTMRPRR